MASRSVLALLLFVALTGCADDASSTGAPSTREERSPVKRPDAQVAAFLGDAALGSIQAATAGAVGDLKHPNSLGVASHALSDEILAAVRDLILDKDTYVFGLKKRSMFLPAVELRFEGASGACVLLVDLDRAQLAVKGPERPRAIDIDPVVATLKKLLEADA